jgi:hypothetical protein
MRFPLSSSKVSGFDRRQQSEFDKLCCTVVPSFVTLTTKELLLDHEALLFLLVNQIVQPEHISCAKMISTILIVAVALSLDGSAAFAPKNSFSLRPSLLLAAEGDDSKGGGFFQGVSNFFQEFDNFLDDASARRLGNGAAFYGKRKSKFYGEKDKNRKTDSLTPDPTEDYQAPNAGGYFKWMLDEDGQMRPVTRMKNKIVERNPNFWDKVYDDDEK